QLGPHGLIFNPVNNRVYTTNVESKTVTVIDAVNRSILGNIGPFTADALGIAVNSTTNKIYVGTAFGKKMVVIDAGGGAFGTVSTEINIGRHVLEVAVDAGRNRVYASSQTLPYSVAVIDGANDTLLGFHPVGVCPWGVAYDSIRDRLYVVNQGEGTVTVLNANQLP
ncbi:MAG TPA: YncE family protein, partial [Candidatus Manganitrophaceae bacterium]|nr:YncE family protein [Candidatus Manganitrophaceae bacterium]